MKRAINGDTRIFGVMGWPVGHSASPAMHNTALESLGYNAVYLPFPVSPLQLPQAIEGLWVLGAAGVNLTIPHKEAVVPLLPEVDPTAALIGSVNTLVRGESGWVGHSTDGPGFLQAFRTEMEAEPAGLRFLILGAGGAARAVAFALAQSGAAGIALANRSMERAHDLGARLSSRYSCGITALPLDPAALRKISPSVDVLINTLPLGMHPRVEETPPVPVDILQPPLIVCDLIYNPRPTRLLRMAAANGCRTLDGLAMLVAQGALSLELWTGLTAPAGLMRAAAEDFLTKGDLF